MNHWLAMIFVSSITINLNTYIMKNLFLCLAFLISSFYLNAQNNESNNITITINNAKSDQGTILVSLHTSETFMKGEGVKSAMGKIKEGTSEIILEDIEPGEYAIMVLHDANDNKRMDFEANGMPKESYGMSNNVMSFGPPQYSDAKFKMGNENISMTIRF